MSEDDGGYWAQMGQWEEYNAWLDDLEKTQVQSLNVPTQPKLNLKEMKHENIRNDPVQIPETI